MSQQITPEQREQLSAVGAASGLGCAIVATLLIMIGGGILLDQLLDTTPVFTLIGVGLGLFGAGYQLWELAQIGQKDHTPPLTRGLAKLSRRGSARRRGTAERDARNEE